jgi:hypothetical protein
MSPQVAELERLAAELGDVAGRLEKLTGYGRRTRRLAIYGVVIFVVDIVLTVVMTFLALGARTQAATTRAQAAAIRQSQLTSCNTGNQLRAEQKALWQGIITTSLAEGPTPGTSRQQLDQNARLLQALVNKAFVQTDCQKLYH